MIFFINLFLKTIVLLKSFKKGFENKHLKSHHPHGESFKCTNNATNRHQSRITNDQRNVS